MNKDKYINTLEQAFLQNLIRSFRVNIAAITYSTKNNIINLGIPNKILIHDTKERWNSLLQKSDKQYIKDIMTLFCKNDIVGIVNSKEHNRNQCKKTCQYWVDQLLKD